MEIFFYIILSFLEKNNDLTTNNFFELDYYRIEFFDFFFFSIIAILISFFIMFLCFIISKKNLYYEKLTGYECGFDPFSDARDPFEIKFYLISILFILFDLELLYFFPWITCFSCLNIYGFFVMYLFYLLLILGFFYEWRMNVLF